MLYTNVSSVTLDRKAEKAAKSATNIYYKLQTNFLTFWAIPHVRDASS